MIEIDFRLGKICGWAIAYAVAGLIGSLISIRVLNFYDPIRWPILLLPRLALFVPALAPLALVHALHVRARIGIARALTIPVAGLGGGIVLIAFCAFASSMVANWSEPYWAPLFPRGLQLAAAIPGPLTLVGGAWFGLVEVTTLRRASRPRGWVLLILPAAIVCAMLIVVTHYFASHARHLEWVAPALISLPIAGAAYGALVEAVLRPDAMPIFLDRSVNSVVGKRLFVRWVLWHIGTALIGGLDGVDPVPADAGVDQLLAMDAVALAIGAVAVYFGLSLAIEVSWWAWPTGIVAASLVFALMTYKVVRPALVLANPAVSAPSPVGA